VEAPSSGRLTAYRWSVRLFPVALAPSPEHRRVGCAGCTNGSTDRGKTRTLLLRGCYLEAEAWAYHKRRSWSGRPPWRQELRLNFDHCRPAENPNPPVGSGAGAGPAPADRGSAARPFRGDHSRLVFPASGDTYAAGPDRTRENVGAVPSADHTARHPLAQWTVRLPC